MLHSRGAFCKCQQTCNFLSTPLLMRKLFTFSCEQQSLRIFGFTIWSMGLNAKQCRILLFVSLSGGSGTQPEIHHEVVKGRGQKEGTYLSLLFKVANAPSPSPSPPKNQKTLQMIFSSIHYESLMSFFPPCIHL